MFQGCIFAIDILIYLQSETLWLAKSQLFWEGILQSVQVEVSRVCLGGCILISKECHCSCSFLKTWGNTHKQDTTQGQTSQRTRNGKPLQSLRVHWEQFIMILGVPTVSYTHVSHHCYCQPLVRWALFLHSASLTASNTSNKMRPTLLELMNQWKIYRKAPYLMGKSMVSCRFSLKPIHWMNYLLYFTKLELSSHSRDLWGPDQAPPPKGSVGKLVAGNSFP